MEPSTDLDKRTLLKILDNSYDEIFVTDARGIVIYVNPICERHYGIRSCDVLGRRAESLVHEGYYSPPIIHQVLQKKQQVNMVQRTNIGKTLLVTATPVFDAGGRLELVVQNARDITQLEVIKQELEKVNHLVRAYGQDADARLESDLGTYGLVGRSRRFRELISFANQIAAIDSNVILLGESGTGKGVLARYIHRMSARGNGPFVTINCAAIPNELIETELFGYAGGAFTGARQKGRVGRLELADGGTLFLDEMAELPLMLQSKLLEVVQDRQFLPVGGSQVKSLDTRIVSATNRDLHTMVAKGTFRRDLYHRLKVIEIEIPPLRKRPEDILPLIHFYLGQYDKQFRKVHTISVEAGKALSSHAWPGNVRELMHTMELLAATIENGEIGLADLPKTLLRESAIDREPPGMHQGLDEAVESLTRKRIVDAYHMLKSSYKVAAFLNISQSRAHRLIRKYMGPLRLKA